VVIPIPGYKSVEKVEENLTSIKLNKMDLKEVEEILRDDSIKG
jgi:aryl-alcohol dehydrogenase-like predicted oxidoreductase